MIFFLQKLWFQHIWPILEQEVRSQEVLAAVLEPVLFLVKECTHDEYRDLILPALRPVFSNPGKSIQASIHDVVNGRNEIDRSDPSFFLLNVQYSRCISLVRYQPPS